mmetsp:Transcript_66233/g.209348  ORF Transcript_66233/g.209348 Transcript_66233/m.209348 type:complete len:340 (+) Transcript_66233:2456-3475(+)
MPLGLGLDCGKEGELVLHIVAHKSFECRAGQSLGFVQLLISKPAPDSINVARDFWGGGRRMRALGLGVGGVRRRGPHPAALKQHPSLAQRPTHRAGRGKIAHYLGAERIQLGILAALGRGLCEYQACCEGGASFRLDAVEDRPPPHLLRQPNVARAEVCHHIVKMVPSQHRRVYVFRGGQVCMDFLEAPSVMVEVPRAQRGVVLGFMTGWACTLKRGVQVGALAVEAHQAGLAPQQDKEPLHKRRRLRLAVIIRVAQKLREPAHEDRVREGGNLLEDVRTPRIHPRALVLYPPAMFFRVIVTMGGFKSNENQRFVPVGLQLFAENDADINYYEDGQNNK